MSPDQRTALAASLDIARERYTSTNPGSQRAYEAATTAMPGGNTRSTVYYPPYPLTMVTGSGCRLRDIDGHVYVDLLGEYTAGLYGHNHPTIRAALDAALDNGWNFGAQGTAEAPLAAAVCARFPSIDLVRFTNSGTEANLLALGTAAATTGRTGVLVFDGAYHGSVLSFGHGGIPINAPYQWRIGTYNDVAGATRLIEQHGPELAAMLVEPMLGSGGCVPADPAFLATLRSAADACGAVLIFDEVMTSRMSGGGMQARLGITPDLTTLGKYIGGGMSFGAFGGRRELMSIYDPRSATAIPHAGTFNNNVLSMAAGLAGLTELFTPEVADDLFLRGERFRAHLNALCQQHRVAMQWTGLGSLLTAHFQTGTIRSAGDIRAASDLRELFHLDMLDAGFYLARRGMIALSLEVTDPDLDRFTRAVDAFLTGRRSALITA